MLTLLRSLVGRLLRRKQRPKDDATIYPMF